MEQLNFDYLPTPQTDIHVIPQLSPHSLSLAGTPSSSKADQAARRREQNRLAQRRHRERKRRQLATGDERTDDTSPPTRQEGFHDRSSAFSQSSIDFTTAADSTPAPLPSYTHTHYENSSLAVTTLKDSTNNHNNSIVDLIDMTFDWDTATTEKSRATKRQATSNSFDAFPDEHIIFLSAQNVERAFLDISKTISKVVSTFKFDPDNDDLISPLNSLTLASLSPENDSTSPQSDSSSSSDSSTSSTSSIMDGLARLPENLRPTKLQLSIPHHPCIDVLPWPTVRDRLLLMGQNFDDDCACEELLNGLRVWGNCPELDDNWEITPRFAYQLWFLLDKDIIKRTNWWRKQRGLLPIDLDAISKAQASSRMKPTRPKIDLYALTS